MVGRCQSQFSFFNDTPPLQPGTQRVTICSLHLAGGHANHRLAWTSKERTIVTPPLALAPHGKVFTPSFLLFGAWAPTFFCLPTVRLETGACGSLFYPHCIDTPTHTFALGRWLNAIFWPAAFTANNTLTHEASQARSPHGDGSTREFCITCCTDCGHLTPHHMLSCWFFISSCWSIWLATRGAGAYWTRLYSDWHTSPP